MLVRFELEYVNPSYDYLWLAEEPGVAREILIQSWYMREKQVLDSTICSKS